MKTQKKKFEKSDNRKQFEELSQQLKVKVTLGYYESVNEALKAHYRQNGHKELKTFFEWLKEGYSVKKGEKALYLWSKPIQRKAKEGTETAEGNERNFHGVICLFSNLQVEQTENNQQQTQTQN